MNRSRSTLFLIEQLIVIAVFAACAAICVSILSASYLMADSSRGRASALQAAQSAAEIFKAVSGDAEAASRLMGGTGSVVCYDADWNVTGEGEAAYTLSFDFSAAPDIPGYPPSREISVKDSGGVEMISLSVSARGQLHE